MCIDRVAIEETAHQHDFGRKQMQTSGNRLGVFAENTCAFLDDLDHTRIAAGCGFKYYRGQHCDLHFVCRLRPANQFIKIVQQKRMQDFRSELHFATTQIVFMQDQAQRLHGKKITAAGIAQNVSPPTGSLDSVTAASSDRGPASSIDDNTVPMVESRSQTRVTVATSHDLRVWPNVGTDEPQRMAIFLCAATGKENPRAIDLLWQLGENFAQTFGRCEAQIGWRQFSLIEDACGPTGIIHPACNFHQRPGGFRATAFDSENSLAWFHDSISYPYFAGI